MIHTRTVGLLAALALGAFLMGGCSSDGEPSVSQGVHDLLQHELDETLAKLEAERAAKQTAQTARQSAETARQTAQAEVTRLEGMIGNLNDAASNTQGATLYARLNHATAEVTRLNTALTTAQGELATANTQVTRLETLVGDPTTPTPSSLRGEIAKLKADLVAAQTQVTVLTGQLGTARTDLTAAQEEAEAARLREQQAQQEAQQQIEEAQRQADVGVRVGALITELTSIDADDAGAGMSVSHARGESRKFTRPLNLPPKGSAPSVPGGWSSASYSGPRGTVGTDTVYLYTNIQAPSSKAFWKVHGESQTVSAGVVPATPRVTISGFGRPAKELYPQADGDPDATSDTAKRSIGGTYDGYSGTFTCQSACDITTAAGSETLTFVGDWTFTTGLTSKRQSSQAQQDTEFLYFGIWAFEPTSASGTPDFKWAAGGDATDIPDANFTALTGEATFTGGAVGKYALEEVEGRAARPARIGTFTATAAFTANFDTDTISGRITNFKEGGSDLGADWNVFLGATAATAATLTAAGVTAITGIASAGAIDGDPATVSWAATLHGSGNGVPDTSSVLSNETKYPRSQYPVADVAGVAGWFSAAAGDNAALAGAFGAACITGTMCAR